MLPSAWVGLVLALAAFRLCRLIGWDDLPPIVRFRNRITGADFIRTTEPTPGYWVFKRPLLAHFLGCAFCLGFWISAAVYTTWRFWPVACIYACAPFALSTAVGLLAKNLDR
jgi:hypothetical protein